LPDPAQSRHSYHALAPPYSGKGRPRKKGQRWPTPQQLIDAPTTYWTRLPFIWYNHPLRQIELSTQQAVWFHNGQSPVPIRFILIRDVAGQFDPQALLCTDVTLDPLDILVFFKRRWQMEPTFRHVREHLGVETQRQWSDKAIARTTPVLLGLFSLITVLAQTLSTRRDLTARSAAWYPKPLPLLPMLWVWFGLLYGRISLFKYPMLTLIWSKSPASYLNALMTCWLMPLQVQCPAKSLSKC